MTDSNPGLIRLGLIACAIPVCCCPTWADRPAVQGPSSKVYSEEEAWQLGWPFLYGPFGNFVPAQTGVDLVHDLANARLVWESEDNDFGRAKHTTGTFKSPGKLTLHFGPAAPSHPGGWAGPIIADGKLFGTSFRPSGPVLDVKRYVDSGTEKARLEAEDLVIALDVKTGKTAWKAIEPGGFVWGVGKRHGFQVAPAYHNSGGRWATCTPHISHLLHPRTTCW